MTIYVGDLRERQNGETSAMMISDSTDVELHIFAERIGVPFTAFENITFARYYVTAEQRELAIRVGAIDSTDDEVNWICIQKNVPEMFPGKPQRLQRAGH